MSGLGDQKVQKVVVVCCRRPRLTYLPGKTLGQATDPKPQVSQLGFDYHR